MSPDAVSAAITVAGMLCVGVIAACVQVLTTRAMVRGELERARLQVDLEAHHRRIEGQRAELGSLLADLLSATDPEVLGRPDYPKAVRLINHIQLLLDVREPHQAALNGALSALGHAAASHYTGPAAPSPERQANAAALFMAQGTLTDAARRVLSVRSGGQPSLTEGARPR